VCVHLGRVGVGRQHTHSRRRGHVHVHVRALGSGFFQQCALSSDESSVLWHKNTCLQSRLSRMCVCVYVCLCVSMCLCGGHHLKM